MSDTKRPLKVFLCHAHADRDHVRRLYTRLTQDGVDAWFDKAKLLPGQDWELEIEKAVRETDVVILCLSNKSVTKEGYVQKEIKRALDIADEKPEGVIFLIPLRFNECNLPIRLGKYQYADYFPNDRKELTFMKVLESLNIRYRSLMIMELDQKSVPEDILAFANLSLQEKYILLHLSEGKTNQEVAKALFLSETTVDKYLQSILSKLKLINRADVVSYALNHDIKKYISLK